MTKLRHNRTAWVAHCRATQAAQEAVRKDNDGVSHSIIPFGAVDRWADIELDRLAQALSAPILTWITDWDESGVGLAIICPYCQREHRHIVLEEGWDQNSPLAANCGKGDYHVMPL